MSTTSTAAPTLTRVLTQGKFETIAMLKNGEQLMLNIAFPIMGLLALAYTGFLDPWANRYGVSRVDIAVPGVLALCVLSTALSGQGIATGFDRRYGVLRFISTTPLGKGGLIAGKVLAVLSVLLIQYLLVGALGQLLGWTATVPGVLMSLPTLLLGAACFTSLGLLIAGTVRAEATLAIVNMAWVLLAAAGGILIPTDRYPTWLSPIIDLLPSAALGNALRGDYIYHSFLLLPHLILLIATVLFAALATRFFKWSA
ncbi:MAG: ABC transporter permease [Rothia sp. (in: high G+C Gram-positive bacteria)]|uniref:ABC transporter permease n=1 Tax=Rothia sp. (in: high G+C Gram-positive bacteria) TaxID=1885016 RepID=UPI002702FB0C|nr:ABC transporter permease [Rothia sp. (in: high G+C Gram-positive bacteria)]